MAHTRGQGLGPPCHGGHIQMVLAHYDKVRRSVTSSKSKSKKHGPIIDSDQNRLRAKAKAKSMDRS